MTAHDVLVVGGSTAGSTAMRELRRRGFEGRLTLLDPETGTHRPPLSKAVLADPGNDATVSMDHAPLDVVHVGASAVGLDPLARLVTDDQGREHRYDALVLASGARARRIAAVGQEGEVVLRTLTDAQRLRGRLHAVSSVVVVGAGFLGLEVASAAVRAGATVTVVDVAPPLLRLLGSHLADHLVGCAAAAGIRFVRSGVRLLGDPVAGVRLDDGSVLEADLVVTCTGDLPEVDWLVPSGVAERHGVDIDAHARTGVEGVWAAGDLARAEVAGVVARRPFWANAVAQGTVVAASILGQEVKDPIVDPYVWTEVVGTSFKAVGPLPRDGDPRVLEENDDGGVLLAWDDEAVVAVGLRRAVPLLRRVLAGLETSPSPTAAAARRD